MSHLSHRLQPVRTPHALFRVLLLGLLLAFTSGSGTAFAGTDSFCNQAVAAGSVCTGPSHSLTAVRGWNNVAGVAGCGGAVAYGSYFCAVPAGCHTYDGTNVLTPGIRHRSATSKSMSGYSTWGVDGPPSYCDPGSVYAVDGPISAAESAQIPVLAQRKAVAAPDDVAFAAPAADLGDARTFTTPAGKAWVVADSGHLCVVVDDRGTGYGYGCLRLGSARTYGSLITLQDGDDSTAKGDIALAITPAGVDSMTVEASDGSKRSVAASGGVAVTTLTAKDRAIALDPSPDAPEGSRAQRRVVRR